MPKIYIDGKPINFDGNHRLLQFALDQDVEIPYFCYHPAMSIPTNCRMCLVEVGYQQKNRETGEFMVDEAGKPIIQWGRKPVTACNTPITDGMFVKTNRTSQVIDTAQKGVLEYMLINHPLDCPICDQAGECPLQIWTFKYGPEGSRFEAQKGHKRKRVELGPNVMLDEERCINCTRCTRFTEEISKTSQLSIVGRGEKNYPSTAPGQIFDDPYSMNVIDICPVGALTSRQHRFKARVWEMAHAPAIDMNDSTGTNIFVWVRDNKVLRITPRKNLQINDYWMPDAHRLNVDFYNENRVSGIKMRGDIPLNFEDGLKMAADLIQQAQGKIFFLGSAYASMESNYALKIFAAKYGVEKVYYVPNIVSGHGDNWLVSDDRTPNAAACEALGFEAIATDEIKALLSAGKISFLYSLENGHFFSQLEENDLDGVHAIVHATHHYPVFEAVDLVLPAAVSIEGEGVYINQKGIAQVSVLAKQIRQMTPEMWMRLPKSRLDKGGVAVDHWRDLENIFDVLPSWELLNKLSHNTAQPLGLDSHQEIFSELKMRFDTLKDITVSYKPPKAAFKSTQLEFAPNW